MNYAIYFGLSFLGCFVALILCAIILSWMGELIIEDKDNGNNN